VSDPGTDDVTWEERDADCADVDLAQQSLDELIASLVRIRDRMGGDVAVYAWDRGIEKSFMRITPTLDDAGEVMLSLREF